MSDFIKVPVGEFKLGTLLKVDLFTVLAGHPPVKFAAKGTPFTSDHVQQFLKEKISWFKMRKDDYAFYVGFNLALIHAVSSEIRLEGTQKILRSQNIIKSANLRITDFTKKPALVEESVNSVNNVLELIVENPVTFKLHEKIEQVPGLLEHSINVAIWAGLLARRLAGTTEASLFKVALCALMHDIGETEVANHTSNEIVFQSHTMRGRDILQSIAGMPHEAAIVALQHHEFMNGGGYPLNLKKDQIHPLSRLISLVNHFKYLIDKEKMSVLAAFRLMDANEDFDLGILNTLRETLNA